jgi:hypothetical protein
MITVSADRWPLVIYRFAHEVTLPQMEAYLAQQEEMLRRRERSAAVVIVESLRMLDSAVLKRQAAWIKDHTDELRRVSLGVALVLTSPLARGMLKALLWMQPMPQPMKVCSTAEEALEWVAARFAQAHIKIDIPTTL